MFNSYTFYGCRITLMTGLLEKLTQLVRCPFFIFFFCSSVRLLLSEFISHFVKFPYSHGRKFRFCNGKYGGHQAPDEKRDLYRYWT